MQISARHQGVLLAALLLASACAQQAQVVKVYENPRGMDREYAHLLVVAVSTDPDQRHELEDRIVLNLLREKVRGVPSYTLLASTDGVLQNDINKASDKAGTDGIIVTHVASVETRYRFQKGREDVVSECRGGDPVDYFLYDHDVIREPDSVKMAHTVVAVTSLYDGYTHERIWTIQSTCFEKDSMSEVLLEEANAIVRQLDIDGLI